MIFCRIGANGIMLMSIVFPLAFSYSATILRKEASSSGTKPWVHHTLAVLAAALAMKGRARVPAAARPTDPRRTERLLNLRMPSLLGLPLSCEMVRGPWGGSLVEDVGRLPSLQIAPPPTS